ncbi:hypothetical protein [Burkholderia multivorans]|uniref:hypothetical protein n=1 Tax=Burkholderia multivorans TaxID=87883 RepID=UPI0011B26A69|nr:hypothetical protein [Burkholderia multivorans]
MSKTLTAAQIEAAKEAGFYWHPVHKGLVVRHSSGSWVSVDDMLARFVAILATQQPEPRASASFIAAAIAVIKAARAHVLTDEHIDALDIAIKIQQGMFKVPEPRDEVTPLRVERHSDMSVVVVFSSCRQASVFEKEILARTGAAHE